METAADKRQLSRWAPMS